MIGSKELSDTGREDSEALKAKCIGSCEVCCLRVLSPRLHAIANMLSPKYWRRHPRMPSEPLAGAC